MPKSSSLNDVPVSATSANQRHNHVKGQDGFSQEMRRAAASYPQKKNGHQSDVAMASAATPELSHRSQHLNMNIVSDAPTGMLNPVKTEDLVAFVPSPVAPPAPPSAPMMPYVPSFEPGGVGRGAFSNMQSSMLGQFFAPPIDSEKAVSIFAD